MVDDCIDWKLCSNFTPDKIDKIAWILKEMNSIIDELWTKNEKVDAFVSYKPPTTSGKLAK